MVLDHMVHDKRSYMSNQLEQFGDMLDLVSVWQKLEQFGFRKS